MNNNDITLINKDSNNKGGNKFTQLLVILVVILLIVVVAIDILVNNVDFKDIFSQTINYTTEKEVTVTDEGIADAVEKLYDATVVVKVTNKNKKVIGWGSGFVYKTDEKFGYILTNHHVVDEAKGLIIEYTDGSEVNATLVGSDEYNDVAVVKVDKESVIKVAEIGKTEGLRLGDTVFAIGTPVGLEYKFTVTRGILSGQNRMVEMTSGSQYYGNYDSWYMNLLQIDASINSGNSGGPLANGNGEVIGITNSKLSSSYSSSSSSIENMGFAIPIEDALNVAEQLEGKGKVTRPVLGVSTTSIEGAEYYDLDVPKDVEFGAVVAEVMKDSNASRAGIKKGDIITYIGDYKIEDYQYLQYYLYRYQIGDKFNIKLIRDGKEKTIEVELKG